MGWRTKPRSLFYLFLSLIVLSQLCSADDASVMQALKKSINAPASLGWTDPNPCKWKLVTCSNDGRVTAIQIGRQSLTGSLPASLGNLTALQRFEVMGNELAGPLPSLAGLSSLKALAVSNNKFTSIPPDFFSGMSSLESVSLDANPFSSWSIPESLKEATSLTEFSANSANIIGGIPVFLGGDTFASLTKLHLALNKLAGGLPESFAVSSVQSLWLNGQSLNGSISVLQYMTQLTEVWLHSNSFSGPLPDFSKIIGLQNFSIRDNEITGPVPASLVGISTLKVVNLSNNLLQGSTPKFNPSVAVDMNNGSNSFCLSDPGVNCDPRVNTMLAVAESVGYPQVFAQNWKGNDPCAQWPGIICSNGNIIVVNFQKMGLSGTISPNFSSITSLQKLILANNDLTGPIPNELSLLPNLTLLDVSNNRLYGQVPKFNLGRVTLKTDGNPDIGKDKPSTPPGAPGGKPGGDSPGSGGKKSNTGLVVGAVIGAVCVVVAIGVAVICIRRAKQKRSGRVQSQNGLVIHPRFSGSDRDAVKITIANGGANGGTTSETHSNGSDIHVIEAGSMVISIQVLKDVTNNFSRENILGRGGFGTVYRGDLDDGTKIAVKRMESGVMGDKGLDEFRSEIAVLTKVRHRHLVGLLGYCLEGNERILVFEYMPQGALSRHLFEWKEEGLRPLEWSKRLIIALDVARGVEYLHGLAHQSFIHRDLKPANILLGDDMRAKVADFGLVRLAPDGKFSVATKLAGTFGYLAPEYAVTGRVTTKIDVYSFGVILMELITGRKALHEGAQNEESVHLVTWFRRMHINKDSFRDVIDPTIDLNDDTLASVSTVAELACHCTAREPSQRPDMGHAVNVLSSLTDIWKPSDPDNEDAYGIDFDMSLPQAVKRWQALEGMTGIDDVTTSSSSFLVSGDNSHTSLTPRPQGFADTFRSEDAR